MPGRRGNARGIGNSSCCNDDDEALSRDTSSTPLPSWFHRCKSHQIFEYDTTAYPFRQLIADWLEVPADQLETLQEVLPPLIANASSRDPIVLHPVLRQAYVSAKVTPSLSSTQRRTKKKHLYSSAQYHRLVNVYRRFIRDVIAPLCFPSGDDSHDDNQSDNNCISNNNNKHVHYQYPPTLRVVLPNGNRTISMHSDREYEGHQAAEINFWLPLTKRVYGNNSLWLESSPGRGDFQPVELQYGQFLRFDGHDCRHYTVQNDTPCCRVSFDFRVVPSSLWKGGGIGQHLHWYTMGDFCVESTTPEGGFQQYWSLSKKNRNPVPCDDPAKFSTHDIRVNATTTA